MLAINNYTFKFPQKKIQYVHYVTPGSRRYHTIPLQTRSGKNQVLLFWKEQPCIKRTEGFITEKIPFEDALYVGNLMKMPVVIVLETNDDAYDLYYIRNSPDEIQKCPKKKNYMS